MTHAWWDFLRSRWCVVKALEPCKVEQIRHFAHVDTGLETLIRCGVWKKLKPMAPYRGVSFLKKKNLLVLMYRYGPSCWCWWREFQLDHFFFSLSRHRIFRPDVPLLLFSLVHVYTVWHRRNKTKINEGWFIPRCWDEASQEGKRKTARKKKCVKQVMELFLQSWYISQFSRISPRCSKIAHEYWGRGSNLLRLKFRYSAVVGGARVKI